MSDQDIGFSQRGVDWLRILASLAQADIGECCWPADGNLQGWTPCDKHRHVGEFLATNFLAGGV